MRVHIIVGEKSDGIGFMKAEFGQREALKVLHAAQDLGYKAFYYTREIKVDKEGIKEALEHSTNWEEHDALLVKLDPKNLINKIDAEG